MLTTYDIPNEWTSSPYGSSDTPGMVATSGWSASGVATDGGVVGTPQQSAQKASAAGGAPKGNPIQGLVIALALLVVLMLVVHHFGKAEEDFSNIKASAYNALIIGLVAVAIIPVYKMLASALATTNLPGSAALNAYVQGS